MGMRPALSAAEDRARFDKAVLTSALDGRHLPWFVPLEPSGVGAAIATAEVVATALEAIAEAHGVESWNPDRFERVLLQQALRAWHGDLEVEHRANVLVVRSRSCPLLAKAARDARVCQTCRAFHVMAAQEAFGPRLLELTFPKLITQGADRCEAHIALAPT